MPADKIFSIPTGVPLDRFYPRPPGDRAGYLPDWPQDCCLIGSVAVLRSWKGHVYLVEALAKVLQTGAKARLVLVGDGPYRVVIAEKVAELNLAQVVFFAGYQDNIPDWLALLDLVVLASYANEGVPQSLLQAMAMARPVIGTTCGGIPEIVRAWRQRSARASQRQRLFGRGSSHAYPRSGQTAGIRLPRVWLWCRSAIPWNRWPPPPKQSIVLLWNKFL